MANLRYVLYSITSDCHRNLLSHSMIEALASHMFVHSTRPASRSTPSKTAARGSRSASPGPERPGSSCCRGDLQIERGKNNRIIKKFPIAGTKKRPPSVGLCVKIDSDLSRTRTLTRAPSFASHAVVINYEKCDSSNSRSRTAQTELGSVGRKG